MVSTAFFTDRQQAWGTVPKYLDSLPSYLFRQSMLLTHNLGLQASATGQFQDILKRNYDYPLFDQCFWLLNDLHADTSQEREIFSADLLLATLLQFLAMELEQNMQEKNTFFTAEYKPLQEIFQHDALERWQRLFPSSSPFWDHYPTEPRFMDKWELGRLSFTAAAIWPGRESDLPHLLSMTDHFISVFQVIDHLSTLLVDVKYGRRTLPIQRALEAVQADAQTAVTYEFVMSALILTGTLKKIIQECNEQVDSALILAQNLNLPSFQTYSVEVRKMLGEVQEFFSLRKKPQQDSYKTFFLPAPDLFPNILIKAESFLTAEPTFYEAWEVQSHAFPKVPKVTGQAFPSALILETMCKHGFDVSKQVDDVFDIYINNGFSYYNESGWVAPDADDLAFALRLSSYSSRPENIKKQLQTPLRWLRENQKPSGQIPVWFIRNDFPIPLNPLSVLYGGECITVEANLMLGLVAYDWQTYQDMIEACAHSWCDRWLTIGLGATGHYTPLFSLWTSLELVYKISRHSKNTELKNKLDVVASNLIERLSLESQRTDLTPQDASFLTLACFCASDSRLPFDLNWLTILFKHQKWDGSWAGEPIYIVPAGRGLYTNWHSSRTITTAFCFHALKTYQSQR